MKSEDEDTRTQVSWCLKQKKGIKLEEVIENLSEEYINNLRDKIKNIVLKLCSKGRLSIGRAAEILDTSIYDLQEMAKEKGIVVSVTEEVVRKSEETTKTLIKKLKKAK